MGDGSIVLILNVSELVQEKQVRTFQKSDSRLTQASRANKAFEILVVDDSFSVRRVVANLVKSAGWQPILAKNGVEALDIVQRATRLPDLILLDVEMPQMDGYELTSTLRAQDAYQHLPIVMLTSRSGEKHRRKAFEVGATEYLVKPYQDTTLVDLVRRLVVQARGTSAV
jgi:chemosensory pili system protein ChpA (sensor histidine kinase/response regulator)